MTSIMIRQIVVVAALAAILCIALLMLSITGAHPSQTGIMLIAPSYTAPSHQLVDWKTMVSPLTASGKPQKFVLREQAIKALGLEDVAKIRTA